MSLHQSFLVVPGQTFLRRRKSALRFICTSNTCITGFPFHVTTAHTHMRNRDPHRENVLNILAICLPIVTMQHVADSVQHRNEPQFPFGSTTHQGIFNSHAMEICTWDGSHLFIVKNKGREYNLLRGYCLVKVP